MKNIVYQLSAAMLAMALAACSSDELTTSTIPETGSSTPQDMAYMSVTVQLPTGGLGTRSQTKPEGGSTDGTEIGQDYENKVNSVLLVLATKDNKFIACGEKTEKFELKSNGTALSTTQSISKDKLVTYYGTSGKLTDTDIRVFVFCNPTARLRTIFEELSAGTVEHENKTEWYDLSNIHI